jgi:YfiH family protein
VAHAPDVAGVGLLVAGLQAKMQPASRDRLIPTMLGDLPVLLADLPSPFRGGFTTRLGGVGRGPFASLNLSPRVGDDPQAVKANRGRLAAAFAPSGMEPDAFHLLSPVQEHGLKVRPALDHFAGDPAEPCDGLLVRPRRDRNLGALLLFADCVPIVVAAEGEAAVLHCGWRGLLAGMIQHGVRQLSAPPSVAFIGPSVGPCCFPVQEEVARAFRERYGADVITEDGRLSLWAVAERALEEAGLTAGQVVNPCLCTACNGEYFFSHRRQRGEAGRQGALLCTHEASGD